MTVKYIVNETGSPIEVLIPYNEFRLLQPLFSLLTEEEVTPNSIQETDISSFLTLRNQKKIQIPFLSQMIQEDR
ncbi:MAG: hypothetical protein KA146_07000, partial [Leptospiraceae bacterium]|nr:hypothetical protein [Leptospiraceae bacterium]